MKINVNNAEFLCSVFDTEKLTLRTRPEIVLVGKSNVGKSSMINKLLNRKSIARVSEKPGKTASINYYEIDKKIYFVDLPGYGYALRAKTEREGWGRLIGDYFGMKRDRRLVLFLIDSRHEPSEDDLMMYNFLMAQTTPFCVIATKTDKLSASALKESVAALSKAFKVEVIPFSAQTGLSVAHIWQIIEDISQDIGDGVHGKETEYV